MRFEGKTVLVTGARRGIGRAIALGFANEGADVAITYRSGQEEADLLVREVERRGQRAISLYSDLTDVGAPETVFDMALSSLDRIDVLVNNAGVWIINDYLELDAEQMNESHHLAVVVPFRLIQCFSRHLINRGVGGSVVNISSISGLVAAPARTAHSCSKAGLNMLTANAALDLACYGIRVNGIAPGMIAGGSNASVERTDPKGWADAVARIPLKRAGRPEDIASAALFLASDEASWLTGVTLPVDGGMILSQ